jgi:hypothetical protein
MKIFMGLLLAVLLVCLTVELTGCSQPGETMAEGSRRHARILRLNQKELNEDLDALFHLDEPSRLTERTLP